MTTRLCSVLVSLALTCSAFAQQSGATLLQKLGYPSTAKLLIIHADDVGMSHSVNVASFEALEKGWVSSASIMVPCPWFNEAAAFARQHPELDLGLHLTLTSEWSNYRWGPITRGDAASLLDGDGYLPRDAGEVGKHARPEEAESEILAQLAKARAAGIRFTHLDNHMGALSQRADLYAAYIRVARQAGVLTSVGVGELRGYGKQIPGLPDLPLPTHIGPASHKNLLEGFRETFSRLEPGVYITVVHLGHDDAELRSIMLNDAGTAAERQHDFELVSNPEFHRMLKDNGIQLIGWRQLAKALAPAGR